MCELVGSSLQYETDQSDEGGCRSVRKRYTVNRIRLQTRNFLDQDCDVPLTAVLPPLMKGSFLLFTSILSQHTYQAKSLLVVNVDFFIQRTKHGDHFKVTKSRKGTYLLGCKQSNRDNFMHRL